MHLTTYVGGDTARLGVVFGERIALLDPVAGWPGSVLGLIEGGPALWARLRSSLPALARHAQPLLPARVLAPIPRPAKNVICLGWNYAGHARESAATRGNEAELPQHPVVFTKNVTSVNGPYGDIPAQPEGRDRPPAQPRVLAIRRPRSAPRRSPVSGRAGVRTTAAAA